MRFEWNEGKNKRNILKHGIDFAGAALVFLDCDRIEVVDNRKDYGETRYRTIGVVNEIILCIVYTIRESTYRIISARRANKNERETYLYNR
ncbi:MAG TPA: BrnT family toxin [Coxiellaceae bacterium]|nr:BrnT family toxin [Coxiellaceae bacterium]HBS51801.1 BrnT family toxin [Coxiellaceae bacterium]